MKERSRKHGGSRHPGKTPKVSSVVTSFAWTGQCWRTLDFWCVASDASSFYFFFLFNHLARLLSLLLRRWLPAEKNRRAARPTDRRKALVTRTRKLRRPSFPFHSLPLGQRRPASLLSPQLTSSSNDARKIHVPPAAMSSKNASTNSNCNLLHQSVFLDAFKRLLGWDKNFGSLNGWPSKKVNS